MSLPSNHFLFQVSIHSKSDRIFSLLQAGSSNDSSPLLHLSTLLTSFNDSLKTQDSSQLSTILSSLSDSLSTDDFSHSLISNSGVLNFVRSVILSEDKNLHLMCSSAHFCHCWTSGNESQILQLFSDDIIHSIFHIFTDLPYLTTFPLQFPITDYHERLFSDFQLSIYNCLLSCTHIPIHILELIFTRTLHYAHVFSGQSLLANVLIRSAIANNHSHLLPIEEIQKMLDLFLYEIEFEEEFIGIEGLRGLSYLLKEFTVFHVSLANPKFLHDVIPRFFNVDDRDKRAPISVVYWLLTSPDDRARMATVRLTEFPRIAELFRGNDQLKQLYCLFMKDVVKANVDLLWQLTEGDVFDDLMILAQNKECFLVREAAVKTLARCLSECDFTVIGRLLLLGIIKAIGEMIEAFDQRIPKAIWCGISAILTHLQCLTKPEIEKYWSEMDRIGIAELIENQEQQGELPEKVRIQRDKLLGFQ
jgi:hypothetical protein